MIRNILFATDFSTSSEQAMRVAAEYALRSGARLHLLHVVYSGEPSSRERLEQLAVPLAGRQLTVVTACKWGDPAERILDYARQEAIDLIVVGTHGRTGVTRVLLGSVSERVARHAACPVLTVPMSAHGGSAARPDNQALERPPRCLVCSSLSPDLICTPCRVRIRGEALDDKREQERKGHVPA